MNKIINFTNVSSEMFFNVTNNVTSIVICDYIFFSLFPQIAIST